MRPKISISFRQYSGNNPLQFLARRYPIEHIESVFGFTEWAPLYGGRPWRRVEITPETEDILYSKGIGVRLPLTNHYLDDGDFQATAWVLDRHHREGNAVITVRDDVARWVKKEFPKYRIEASCIEHKTEDALELYDEIVLPSRMNADISYLKSIQNKERVRLFVTAGCAFMCPKTICYRSYSRFNKTRTGELACYQDTGLYNHDAMIRFDIDKLMELGFTKFKAV